MMAAKAYIQSRRRESSHPARYTAANTTRPNDSDKIQSIDALLFFTGALNDLGAKVPKRLASGTL